ncbi:TerB family tellurite resistance protein [Bizionia gelidisalsuginis]|uniref:TerB family tellurite resistance protein n=1 Tax=Bizionia gelidisalsuginis TaxID=291188 RepID=A0ABY3MDQ1_9FLAO|nr:TerB family tellurite resistance protein [Bizionia gelidisalsuginis]TYC17113.1 TerB family tellurite resistance protein [Bizionia gelidisalsuginis]
MSNRIEKICLLSDIMAFIKSDKIIESIDFEFILDIAQFLKVSQEDFDYAITNAIYRTETNNFNNRILHFYNLVSLLPIEYSQRELEKLFTFGLKMCLSHELVTKVLYLIESFPNRRVPKEVLIDAAKVQYN